jgi:5-methylcytosine-specific restriction endonuclease McrA
LKTAGVRLRRKKRDGIHKPIEYYKPLSEQKIHLEERLKELRNAQPDVVAFNLKLTAGEQFVKEQCRSEFNQRRRGLFRKWICLKQDPLTLIHNYFGTLKKWELQLIEKWPTAYPTIRKPYGISPVNANTLDYPAAVWEMSFAAAIQALRYDVGADIACATTRLDKMNEIQAQMELNRLEQVRIAEEARVKEELKREIQRLEQARISALLNRARSGAKQIRLVLPRDHPCPYCGGPLGNSPHADHIHPVAKGGLSTRQNMVYICTECNTKKSHTTLTAFAAKEGRDLTEILARLRALGKEF